MTNSPTKGNGKGIQWIRETLAYEGDECRLWPMSKDRYGYGCFGYLGEHYYAHRFMCELVNGPPPTPEHQAGHFCGKGHTGAARQDTFHGKPYSEAPAEDLDEAQNDLRHIYTVAVTALNQQAKQGNNENTC